MRAAGGWRRAEALAERCFLAHGADVGPLLHVACYYAAVATLWLHLAEGPWARGSLWVLVTLLNYSLSVGILHLHAHRPLFRRRAANRALDLLLCLPSLVTASEMQIVHVHHHHRHGDGPTDVTSTLGRERGLAAVGYWLGYGFKVKSFTLRAIYGRGAPRLSRRHRARFACDWGLGLLVVALLLWRDPATTAWVYLAPLFVSHTTIGYFSWLTHAPARGVAGPSGALGASLNNVNNVLNLFIFNQGYHAVHHLHPGIHWSDIPNHLEVMRAVPEALIAPYWVTPESAWRIVAPARFRTSSFGRRWKGRLAAKGGAVRLRCLPYFAWI